MDRSCELGKLERYLVYAAGELGLVDPSHLAQQAEPLASLRQDDQREGLDAVLPPDPRELGEEEAAQAAALELVDHRHRDLRDVSAACTVVACHAYDSLLAARPVSRGDDGKPVVVVD